MLRLLDFKTKLQESGIRDFLSFLSMRDLVTRGRPLTPETIPKLKNRLLYHSYFRRQGERE